MIVKFNSPALTVKIGDRGMSVSTGIPIVRDGGEFPEYEGEYVITPMQETQTLDTAGKLCVDAIIVNPIPSNYGLITWDGSSLTVS